jgi:hypothetical protein
MCHRIGPVAQVEACESASVTRRYYTQFVLPHLSTSIVNSKFLFPDYDKDILLVSCRSIPSIIYIAIFQSSVFKTLIDVKFLTQPHRTRDDSDAPAPERPLLFATNCLLCTECMSACLFLSYFSSAYCLR